jgi:hypothetical protein
MSGPGGASTKRDQRRETRREQYQRRQLERARERQRQLRNQQIKRWSIIGGSVAAGVLLLVVIINAIIASHATPVYNHPGNGETIDGIECQANEQVAQHIHSYLNIYVNGQQQQVPPGTGIVAPANSQQQYGPALGVSDTPCYYWLHVHQNEPSIIHIESPNQDKYSVANLFHIWGQQIGGNQFMGNKVDANHKLVIEVFDNNGKLIKTMNGDPSNVQFADHQTIVILYNSPNVKAGPYDWSQFGG